ncbi:DNA-binding protein YbiB [Ottowia thiooxydans]|uniref:DNA-binding protein YbiB n=1 Tax=Ottowia thiooxydans TaxID=219182 RepID=UPI00041B7640|nr:DNA-binding protein YbiB [Ottowia thiooxydans]
MGISTYLKEIGRGAQGARSLTREQAQDMFGQILDGQCTDLEIGAFCIAMRIKGETAEEMAGFLDAVAARMTKIPESGSPVIVLPSYNGARKLPVLTPLLGLLLARQGLPVLLHGTATESTRVTAGQVLLAMGIQPQPAAAPIQNGSLHWVPTEHLLPSLTQLLEVRRTIGLRNPAHSLVKLMNPCAGASLVVGSYTHPEYAVSMAATFRLMNTNALLLRGTEGEPVADARRIPRMELFQQGQARCVQEAQAGPLTTLPELPAIDAASTAAYTQSVLDGTLAVPEPIARQVEHISRACMASA